MLPPLEILPSPYYFHHPPNKPTSDPSPSRHRNFNREFERFMNHFTKYIYIYKKNHIKISLIKLFMAHMVSSLSSNTKSNPPFLCHRTGLKPLSKTLCFNPRLPISKCTNKLTHPTSICRPIIRVSNGLSDTHDDEKRRKILLPPAASVSGSMPEISDSNGHRIWFSDVIVDRPKRLFGGRKWNSLDIGTASVVVIMHLISIFAPFTFNWRAFRVAVALYVATGLLGICLSFHRNLSHRSFRLPKWLEYFCAYFGVLALQGNPIDWVSTHRYHHQYCDSSKDPHSPLEGFWFSHMNWLFDTDAVIDRCGEASNVLDLEKQGFYRFIRSTYIFHPLALGVLLYASGGIPYIVWGMGVRTIWVYHITWLVNSACHVWGTQSWNTGDLSTNNWWVALLSFGEGWHNNHHAFEYSARHGLQWWEIDMTWYTVRLLQLIGLAKDVKVPGEAHKKRMAFGSDNGCIAG